MLKFVVLLFIVLAGTVYGAETRAVTYMENVGWVYKGTDPPEMVPSMKDTPKPSIPAKTEVPAKTTVTADVIEYRNGHTYVNGKLCTT